MKLTKLEKRTLSIQLEVTNPLIKPNNCCVVIIHRESNQVWFVEKFTTFRKCLKEMPWLYEDFKKFKYELKTIQ